MRSRRPSQEHVADVARRRLELLSAELAAIRPDPVDPPVPGPRDGSGEPLPFDGVVDGDPDPEPVWPPPAALSGARIAPPTRTEPAPPTAALSAGAGRHAHRPVGALARLLGWTGDRLPPTAQGRVRVGGAHLAVIGVVVLVGVALTAWWVAQARGGETALAPVVSAPSTAAVPSSASGAASPAGASTTQEASGGPAPPGASAGAATGTVGGVTAGGTAAGGSGEQIVVDVTGKVRRPGIATLPQGARVVDALQAAGGPRRGASLRSLNLARVLADGEQIVVGVPAPAGVAAPAASGASAAPAAGSSSSPTALVNVNTADQAALETLPGIGPVTARAILDYRTQKGGFGSVDELLEVSGIGDATLAKISPYCTL